MAKQLESLLAKFQSNVYWAMLRDLSRHLGVSAESLARLEIGWAPIVKFKKGENYQGWWVIPERDATGTPVGLSLRSQQDFKVMYPGSKHGLVYEVNPDHERGSVAFKHGPHNWIRMMDAGRLCPVCLKPDGCLVTRDDVDDPRACVCIRVPSDNRLRFGYLHILKPEGQIRGASPLPASDLPVIVVEGMTDTAAALDLGFQAVGRPSNLACMDMLRDLLRGRRVIIVGENDAKPDGRMPGEEGAIATFQSLKHVVKDVKRVQPPEHLKDLRAWYKAGLTQQEFLDYVEKYGTSKADELVLPDEKPRTLARAFMDDNYRMAGRYTLRSLEEQWFEYTGHKYKEVNVKTKVRGEMHDWLDNKMVQRINPKTGETSIVPIVPSISYLNNIFDGMTTVCPIFDMPPCWINGATGPDPRDIIAFDNGLLWISKYLEGADESEYMLDPTPDFFTLAALPYPFDPTAKCPTWKRYLWTSLPDDVKKHHLIAEWFGYCMTADTSMQKLMLFRGPSRAGKSVAINVLKQLVGEAQAGSATFSTLTYQFGLQGLVDKLICTMNEAIITRNTDQHAALQKLLSIVGEDPQDVPRKHLPSLQGVKLMTRFTLSANELPQLPDHSGAMLNRLLLVEFTKSFVGREDHNLFKKLRSEIPGIAVWALEGLRRLREQGGWTVPESMKVALQEWRTTTSPTAAFIEEACDVEPDAEVGKKELYDAWLRWSQERNMRMVSMSLFKQRVRSNCPTAVSATYIKDGHKVSVWRGLKLKPWAVKHLLGRPR